MKEFLNKEEEVMLQGSKEERYLNERWRPQRDYYSKAAKRNKQWHQSLLLISSIGAVVVPVLLTIPEIPKWFAIIISLLVSVALVLDHTLHFGDNWQSFRQTLEALKRERVYYENGLEPYSNSQSTLLLFIQRCEELMGQEKESYFEMHKQKEYITISKVTSKLSGDDTGV
jgi:ABC-type multidrug transport system fused ATPase/permease subunit